MPEQNILEIFQGAAKNLCNSVLNQVQDAVVWLDKDRKVVYWNKAAERMSGIEGAHILGRTCFGEPPLFVDFGGVNVCRDKCPVAMTLKDGAPRELDVYLQHKQGFRMPAYLRIIPVLKEDGEIIGAVETFTSTAPKVTLPLGLEELEKMGWTSSPTSSVSSSPNPTSRPRRGCSTPWCPWAPASFSATTRSNPSLSAPNSS
jgi:transcriptional regulator with PAS, ATPase and Fis domain